MTEQGFVSFWLQVKANLWLQNLWETCFFLMMPKFIPCPCPFCGPDIFLFFRLNWASIDFDWRITSSKLISYFDGIFKAWSYKKFSLLRFMMTWVRWWRGFDDNWRFFSVFNSAPMSLDQKVATFFAKSSQKVANCNRQISKSSHFLGIWRK